VECIDPNGYMLQLSELVDPRSRLAGRRAAKEAEIAASPGTLIRAFDHFYMRRSDLPAMRDFYGRILGLTLLSHRIAEHKGRDLEENVYAVGAADLELYSAPREQLDPGLVRSLALWSDDVDAEYKRLIALGVAVGNPPADSALLPWMRRRAFTCADPDGFLLQIAQCA
jgi:catechol 2,3-dioxygenase-like lactoylglutathione lyase family enzyme